MHGHAPQSHSNDISNIVLERINELKISTSPENYHVWHAYYSNSNQELCQHIDQLIKEETLFTEEIHQGIHKRFFGEDQQKALDDIRNSISQMVNLAGSELGNMGQEITHFESSLTNCEEKLTTTSSDMLQQLIVRLLSDTRHIHDTTRNTSQSMSQLSDQVDAMRSEIEELTKDASIDALTELSNRRIFDKSYAKLMSDAYRLDFSFSLLMLDIDHFKRFNDEYGHTVGDMVLRFVGIILNRNTKSQDVATRYGGEEFAILLPGTSLQEGMAVAERLRQSISKQTLRVGRKKRNVGKISVSIGVAQFQDSDEGDSLINRADECLYKAKNEGRNRVYGERALKSAKGKLDRQ